MNARPAALLGGLLTVSVFPLGCNGNDQRTPHADCTQLDAIPRRLWRLSAMQYGNAVKDVLGLDTAPVLSNNGGTVQRVLQRRRRETGDTQISIPFLLEGPCE